MQPVLSILSTNISNDNDLSIKKIAQLMGIEHETINLNQYNFNFNNLKDIRLRNKLCLALSCPTLIDIHEKGSLSDFKSFVEQKDTLLLIFDITPRIHDLEALVDFSDGAFKSVSFFENDNYKYKICEDLRPISREFTGLSFGPINRECDFKLEMSGAPAGRESMVTVNNEPIFVRFKKNGCEIFLLAVGEILDIEDQSDQLMDTAKHFSKIVPVMMFLKYAFGEYCWHSKSSQACLVIDDPLLRKKYGFLEYETFLKLMHEKEFATNIAFIPWNYRRTKWQTAELFRRNLDKFSISVHGCDHTQYEFGLTDYQQINDKVKLATKRMKLHETSTGLSFDKVMVFPQGIFSVDSMKVLKANNYLAAVNTEVVPVNAKTHLKMCDLMRPAILDYENFPLFLRRYPGSISDFAFDLFLGRPVLIVIHHDFLREGYDRLVKFIEGINAMDQNIKWNSLESIIENSYWERRVSEDTIHVDLFAGKATIRNTSSRRQKYIISKKECQDFPISNVTINGRTVRYQISEMDLEVKRHLEADETIDLEITYQDIFGPSTVKRNGVLPAAKTYLRRYLSEIRDNILCKNDFFLETAYRIKRLVS